MAEKTTTPPSAPAAPAATITKVEAVGKAMASLGKDASRADIQAFLKKTFGFDMSIDHISNCKTVIQRKQSGVVKAKKKPAMKAMKVKKAKKAAVAKPAARTTTAPKPAVKTASPGHALTLKDVEITRNLLQKVGSAQLKSLIDLLAK